jgi:2-polyprenyl-3-methyl-5-hydroxy-6-metoxy-1,4-benzoquinol methylase
MTNTKNYYEQNSVDYIYKTKDVDFSYLYTKLDIYTLLAKSVLDIGCGSGRDAVYFAKQGKCVTAIDFAQSIIEEAKTINNHENISYRVDDVNSYETCDKYDLIWANASLLHLTRAELSEVLISIKSMLSNGGYFYSCFKQGEGSSTDKFGRFYSYYSQSELEEIFEDSGFEVCEIFTSSDSANRSVTWINVVVRNQMTF